MNNINNKEAAEISGVVAGSALRGSNDPASVSTAVLAYIGDAVYERYVRLHVFEKGILRPDRLNTAAVRNCKL